MNICKYYDKLITITTYICMLGENIKKLRKNEGRESVRVVCVWVRVECQTESAIED